MTVAGRWYRASGDKQDETNQVTRVEGRIAERGWIPGKEYIAHALSASKREHLELLREAIADMRSGLIDCLVMRHTDRIDRTEDLGPILKEVKEAGGWIESLDEPWVSELAGLPATVMTAVTSWMNAEYVRKLSANTQDALTARRAVGSFASGRIPYGYAVTGFHADGSKHEDPRRCLSCAPRNGGRKTLIPVEMEAAIVLRIFVSIAAGKSCGQMSRELHADGVATGQGRVAWADGTIVGIIRNPVHRGIVQANGVTYMTVDPIVPSALWKAANDALTGRGTPPGRGGGRHANALLRPVCGRCGAPMYSKPRPSKADPSDWHTYRCAGVGPGGNSAQQKGCGNAIKAKALDADVTAEFESADDAEIEETVISGSDYANEIAQIQLAVKDLDLMADDYDGKYAGLITELRRLRALPSEPAKVVSVPTGRTEGDAFKAMTYAERQAFVRLWTLTIYPEGEAEPRWKLSREK